MNKLIEVATDKLSEVKVLSLSERVTNTGVFTNAVTVRVAEGIKVTRGRRRREKQATKLDSFSLHLETCSTASRFSINFNPSLVDARSSVEEAPKDFEKRGETRKLFPRKGCS